METEAAAEPETFCDMQDLVGKLCSNQNVPIDDELIASTVAPLRGSRFGKKGPRKAKRIATRAESATAPAPPSPPAKVPAHPELLLFSACLASSLVKQLTWLQ